MATDRPPLPPFALETARQKVRAAEDGWNGRDPERVSLAYTEDSVSRNGSGFLRGRAAIVTFLTRKRSGNWFRAYGNENWEFDSHGLMRVRHASINDLPIAAAARLFHWDHNAPRPAEHPGLSDLGL